MHIRIDFENTAEYESGKSGVIIEDEISGSNFDHFLTTIGCCIEDFPRFHCRVFNDIQEEFYLCITVSDR